MPKKHLKVAVLMGGLSAEREISLVTGQAVYDNLDNKKYIDCTPDHKFLTRNGKWVEAQSLTIGQSLMPLYTRPSTNKKISNYSSSRQKNSGSYKRTSFGYFKKSSKFLFFFFISTSSSSSFSSGSISIGFNQSLRRLFCHKYKVGE